LSWNGKQLSYANTEHSFLFALRSREDGGNILSVCKDYSKAIYNNSDCGPEFGRTDLGVSLFNIAKKATYCTPIRQSDERFDIQEIEVFQVQTNFREKILYEQ
jgi:hypothetical protein